MNRLMRSLFLALPLVAIVCAAGWAADPGAPLNAADYKPPIRVACLGDSITYGVGAKPGWSWPDQLDRMLGQDWDVRNYGHSGATVGKDDKHSIWNQKEYKAALEFHPDVVLILLGTNDTKPQNWAAKADFPKLYKDLVVSFQKLSSKPRILCGLPPYVAKKGNFGINEAAVKEQAPMIQQVAKDWGAGVVDVHAALDGKDDLYPDSVHPNDDGARLIARTVYKTLAGKEWPGDIPGPQDVKKSKIAVPAVENPGELSYRDVFAFIASETGMPPGTLEPIRRKFEETGPLVDAKIAEFEAKIKEYDELRMKYKQTPVDADKPLYGEYKGKVAQAKKELDKYKRDRACELIAMVPQEYKAKFGAAWVNKYVLDRLAPIAVTLTPEQRSKIRELCRKEGQVYGNITNTPERSIEDVETYKAVYQAVLTDEQTKRVEPR